MLFAAQGHVLQTKIKCHNTEFRKFIDNNLSINVGNITTYLFSDIKVEFIAYMSNYI